MATKPVPKPKKLGTLVDELYDVRDRKGALQAQMKILEEEESGLETQMLVQMEEQGLDQVRGEKATVSISKSKVPQVKDWDALNRFILRHKALHLYQRRLAVGAYREAIELNNGKQLPGVEEFDKTTLNVRKV